MASDIRWLSYGVFVLDARLPARPTAVWPFISDPDRMNRWSSAPIHGVEPGDGGRFDTVGTLRQVVLPRPLAVATEVVQYADAPSRFVYRAVGSRAIRYHHGELVLAPESGGTWLRWRVAMALAAPGATAFAQRVLRSRLEESVARLAVVVRDAPEAARTGGDFHDRAGDDLIAAARATAAALQALADDMQAGGDARHWFSRVYQYVTEEMVRACGRGEIAHPAWALRLIPRFHTLYIRSVDGPPEPHWGEAFDAIGEAGGAGASAALPFWRALVAGARAHIEGDLPRVLADVYAEHYRGRCDYERFRADFMLLGTPLQRAWQRLATEVPARWFPAYLRVLDRVLPPEAVEHLTAKRFYDPMVARRHAFEQGRLLATAPAPRAGTGLAGRSASPAG